MSFLRYVCVVVNVHFLCMHAMDINQKMIELELERKEYEKQQEKKEQVLRQKQQLYIKNLCDQPESLAVLAARAYAKNVDWKKVMSVNLDEASNELDKQLHHPNPPGFIPHEKNSEQELAKLLWRGCVEYFRNKLPSITVSSSMKDVQCVPWADKNVVCYVPPYGISGSRNGVIDVVPLSEKTPLIQKKFQSEPPVPIQALDFDDEHLRVLSAGYDKKIHLTELQGKRQGNEILSMAFDHPIIDVKFAFDFAYVGVALSDKSVVFVQVDSQRVGVRFTDLHNAHVHGIAFAKSLPLMATCAADGAVKVWCIYQNDDGQTAVKLLASMKHDKPVNCVAVHPDGRLIAFGGSDLHLWHWQDGSELVRFADIPQNRTLYSVRFDTSGERCMLHSCFAGGLLRRHEIPIKYAEGNIGVSPFLYACKAWSVIQSTIDTKNLSAEKTLTDQMTSRPELKQLEYHVGQALKHGLSNRFQQCSDQYVQQERDKKIAQAKNELLACGMPQKEVDGLIPQKDKLACVPQDLQKLFTLLFKHANDTCDGNLFDLEDRVRSIADLQTYVCESRRSDTECVTLLQKIKNWRNLLRSAFVSSWLQGIVTQESSDDISREIDQLTEPQIEYLFDVGSLVVHTQGFDEVGKKDNFRVMLDKPKKPHEKLLKMHELAESPNLETLSDRLQQCLDEPIATTLEALRHAAKDAHKKERKNESFATWFDRKLTNLGKRLTLQKVPKTTFP